MTCPGQLFDPGYTFLSMDGLLGVQILEIFYIKVSREVLATTQGARSLSKGKCVTLKISRAFMTAVMHLNS